jgi:hypothetical protein
VLRVEHDARREWLIIIWQPQQDVDTSRHGCAVVLECVRRHRCRRILNDSRAVCSFWADAAESIGTHFAAELVAAGIERAAWLNGASIYDQLSTRQTMAYVTQPLAQVFDDYQEAVHWLASD